MDDANDMKLMQEQKLLQDNPIKELETFREGYNDDVQVERSSASLHEHMYESLCMKKPQESYPVPSQPNEVEAMADGVNKNKTQPLMERIFTEPCLQPLKTSVQYSHMKAI